MNKIQEIIIENYQLPNEERFDLLLTYQCFGQPLFSAPIVVVNHALTGNSEVAGENGWWNSLIAEENTIDLCRFTVIAFNIPGNAFDKNPKYVWEHYKIFSTKIIADLFWKGLKIIGVNHLFAVIGGSLGGSIGWEMLIQTPTSIEHLIPIATSLEASDWLIGNTLVQENILKNSSHPIEDARSHAMLTYRTPISFAKKFEGKFRENEEVYEVESWLMYHGRALKNRLKLGTYLMLNHLLKTIGKNTHSDEWELFVENCTANIHVIAIDSDLLFTKQEQEKTHDFLLEKGLKITYQEINSIHGHDAFLIEYKQLRSLLKPIFKNI